jgi:HSP20 family molecular chaperone IbpA
MTDIKVQKVPAGEDRSLPVFAEVERLLEQVRREAFALFEGRGYGDGRALDDWLAAEKLIFGPDTETIETDEQYEIRVPLEGFKPADVRVTVAPHEVIVKAAATVEDEDAETASPEMADVRRSRIASTDVYRRVELPSDIVVESVSATLKRGVLKVVAPKAGPSSPVEVPVAA